jgi:hypothetical protein
LDKSKLFLPIECHQTKNPLPIFRRGLYDIRDDVDMPLICPTRQAQKQFGLAHRQSNGPVGRRAAQ